MKSTLLKWSIRTLCALAFLVSSETFAQVSIATLPYAKSDNFDLYNPTNAGNTSSTLPAGWVISNGTSYQGRGTGTGTAGGFYAFGTGGDYSAGALRSGTTAVYTYTVSFTNNSGTTITDITLSWKYEQWRYANTSGWDVTGTGALAANATLNAKDFTGVASGTAGNVATTNVASFNLTGLSIANGQSFGITWSTTDATGSDNGVSIDDFNIQASGVVMQNQTISFDPLANATYGDGNITLTGSATSSLAVSYASSDTNVATIIGNTLTIKGAGTTNITASQAGNGSYNPAPNVIQSLTINPKNLTVSNATAQNKTYDRTTAATITGATAVGTVNSDAITISGGGTFADFNIGTAKTVTPALTFSGTHASSYTLTQPTGLAANITAKELTVSDAEAQDKLFDGNDTAVITGTLSGVIAPDVVTFNGTGTFASSAAAQNIAVTSTSTIGGDNSNYNLTQPTGLTANIYAEALLPQTITFNPLTNVTYGDANFNLTATASSSLTVAYSSSNTDVATVSGNTVTIVGAGTTTITATQEGNGTYEEATPVDQTLTVDPKALTVTASANNKIYNGNNSATISGTLNGVINSDVVTFNGTGTFASSAVGTGMVTSTSTIGGADAANYTLTQPTGLTADITPKIIFANSAVANNKVYDGNTNATISNLTLTGVIGGDIVTATGSGTFASAAVANGISVTAALTLSGPDAGNYTLSQPTLSANITRLGLTISGLTGNNKVYDRTIAATLGGTAVLSGFVVSDDVFLSGTPASIFNNRNAGTAKPITVTGYTLSGTASGNYTVAQPTGITGNITPASVTITGAAAQNKMFDGNTNAVITGTLAGVISPDVVTLNGTGTFATAAVGNGIAVTSTSTLGGTDGGNYTINPQPIGLTANITPGPTILNVGDLSIIGFNVNAPDNFAFVCWVDIETNTYIKFTDNPFFSSGSANAANNVRGGEQFVMWRNNGAIIPAGTVITISDSPATNIGTIVSGNLNALANGGDNIFAYQGSATSGSFPDFVSNANPTTFNGTILFGLYLQGSSSTTTWLTTGTATSNNSFLPSQLNVANGNIALGSSATRGQYTGPRNNQLSLAGYKAQVTNPGHWTTGASSGIITLNTTSFTLATPPTASVMSGAATICVGESSSISVAVTGGTSPYVITYTDGTNQYVIDEYISGNNIGVEPTETSTYTIVSVVDNNSLVGTGNSGSATITVNQQYSFYTDADGDNFGAGDSVLVCSVDANTPPAGYSLNNTDCNDNNIAIYQSASLFTDADNDGYTVGTAQPVCYGATIPAGYALSSNGEDCNDANNAIHQTFQFYTDNDLDGFGTGSLVDVCALNSATPPTGYSLNNTDCNDANIAVYQSATLYVDADLDGYTTGVTQVVCYGATIPSGFVAALTAIDCNDAVAAIHPNAIEIPYNGVDDDCDNAIDETGTVTTTLLSSSCGVTLASIQSLVGIVTVAGHNITGYRIRITNGSEVQVIEKGVPNFTFPQFASYAYATTYTVDIQLQRAGVWQASWGAPCFVSTPAILEEGGAATVSPSQCGLTLPKINTLIATTSIAGVTGYRFRVTNLTDVSGPNAVQVIDRALNWFSLQMLTRYNYGTMYRIEVAVKTTGTYGGYGAPCEVSSPASPSLINCGGTVAGVTTAIGATSVQGATQYRFQITRDSDGASTTIDRGVNWFAFNSVPTAALSAGVFYNVRVAVMTTGTWSPFGDICQITSPGVAAKGTPTGVTQTASEFRVTASPNPFTADFGIDVITSSKENVQLKVYDMMGKLIESREIQLSDMEKIGSQYPSGVYNVVVSQDGIVKTLRVIKR